MTSDRIHKNTWHISFHGSMATSLWQWQRPLHQEHHDLSFLLKNFIQSLYSKLLQVTKTEFTNPSKHNYGKHEL
jgi:hypothetical protein